MSSVAQPATRSNGFTPTTVRNAGKADFSFADVFAYKTPGDTGADMQQEKDQVADYIADITREFPKRRWR
jgi:hypothetical protein